MHPTAAAEAARVSELLPSSFALALVRVVNPIGQSGAQRVKRGARRVCSAAHTHARRPALAPVGIGRDLDGIVAGDVCDVVRTRGRRGCPCQLASDPAAPRRGVRCCRESTRISVRSWVFLTLLMGVGAGRRTYCCPMPERLLVGDTTPTDQVAMVRTIVSGIMPVPSPHRPRARAVIAHAQPAGGGGHPA
ncbi:hypothetical protein EVAR_64425_1 [Eumeta japonica]|uniref:Uncharacterized protein n=1 Tax=Eumeta variegata TaxID=151549 RepID=A0A4C1ZJ28_EUMVA|nr:hypothetical protein EVAR_64425_1 [Eumeta japonica]